MRDSLPFPSDPSQEILLTPAQLRPVLEKLLVKSSMFQFDAEVAVSRILEADAYGVPSHGVALFCRLLDAIEVGDVDPRARVLTVTDTPALAVLDGSRALGMVAATKGAQLAIDKARESGLAAIIIGNSQTLGAAEVYVRLMAQEGLIGLCLSSTGTATVAAPGTRAGAVGNCAFAYAVPLGSQPPLVFDTACGEESWGKLQLLRRYNIPLPGDLLRDEQWQPTTDLTSARSMPAAGGALGFGLSLLCSTLAGPLVGGKSPLHKKRRNDADDSQHFLLTIDPARCGDVEKFQLEMRQTLADIRSLPPEDPADPVRIPGDRGAQCRERADREGLAIHVSLADEIRARAAKKKIETDW